MFRIALCCSVVLSLAFALARATLGSSPALSLTSYAADATAAHAISFHVDAGDLEIYRARITYGDGFRLKGGPTAVCSVSFAAGTTVQVRPSGEGAQFGGWSGCDTVTGASRCNVVLNSNRTVTATFVQ